MNIKKVILIFVIIFLISSLIQTYTVINLTGQATQGTISLTILPQCNFNLKQGWNLISLCANATNTSISHLFQEIDNEYSYIMEWNTTSQKFEIYSPKSNTPPFTQINLNRSYFIYYQNPSKTLGFTGPEFNDLNLSLLAQWNTPAFPYLFDTNVSKYLLNLPYQFLMKWNTSNQKFLVYSAKSTQHPFSKIFHGEGQFLYMINPAYLYYNKTYLKN